MKHAAGRSLDIKKIASILRAQTSSGKLKKETILISIFSAMSSSQFYSVSKVGMIIFLI